MLFARGQQAAEEVYMRFAWWGNTTRDQRTIQVIQMYMERNPGVTIEPETGEFNAFWPRMTTLAAAGNLPELLQHDVSFIRQFAERNQLADLQPFVQRGLIDLTHWEEGGLAAGRLDGKLVGLVLGTNTWGMGIDPAVLQRAGITSIDDEYWTWADFERIALQIYQRTGVQTNSLFQFRNVLEHTTRQFGNGLFAPNQRELGITNNPAAQAAVKEILDIFMRLRAAGALHDPEDSFIMGRAMEEMPLAAGRAWNDFFWSNQFIGHSNAARRPLAYIMLPTIQGNRRGPPFANYFRAHT
jgi:multiple sugar transport system substrate-binding protein